MRQVKRIKNKKFQILFCLLGCLVFGLCFLLILANFRASHTRKKLSDQLLELQAKIIELSQEKTKLEGLTEKSNDFEYLEQVARDDFNLRKQGETVVAFPFSNSTTTN